MGDLDGSGVDDQVNTSEGIPLTTQLLTFG